MSWISLQQPHLRSLFLGWSFSQVDRMTFPSHSLFLPLRKSHSSFETSRLFVCLLACMIATDFKETDGVILPEIKCQAGLSITFSHGEAHCAAVASVCHLPLPFPPVSFLFSHLCLLESNSFQPSSSFISFSSLMSHAWFPELLLSCVCTFLCV